MARKSTAKTAGKSAGRKTAKKAAKRAVGKVARPKARRPARRQAAARAAAAQQSVTPYLVVSNGEHAIEFYKKAFGAGELYRMPAPDGRLMHASLEINGSCVMLSDEFPEHGGNRAPDMIGSTTVTIHLQVPNADKAFAQAVAAGATVIMPLADMFWGDRYGKLRDPFGHEWSIAHHVRDVPPAEIAEAAKKAFPA